VADTGPDNYRGAVQVGGPVDVRRLPGLTIAKVAVGPMSNNAYLLRCTQTGEGLLIDAANEAGRFADELVAVGEVERDEHPRPETSAEKLATLKPAFRQGGSVTAGNSSGVNDGAAALMIASEERARALGVEPLGIFAGSAVAGVDPRVMGIGPVPAVRRLLDRVGLTVADLDLVELNEAFASQSVAVARELGIDDSRLNVNGGAIAIGHPLGMSGARLVVSLLHELRRRDERRGIVTIAHDVARPKKSPPGGR